MLEEDFEPFTDKLMVEISVRFGDNHGCQLTTIVGIENFLSEPVKTRARLNSILDVLIGAIPIEKLRGLEKEYYDKREVMMGPSGQMILTNPEIAEAMKGQHELKKRIKPDLPSPSPSGESEHDDESRASD
jgi:hypothetical protein